MTSPPVFAPGTTAVRRDVLAGRVWTAAPHRVLHDDGTQLALAYWPGVATYSPTTWIRWLADGDDSTRKQAITDLAAGTWTLGEWVWRDKAVLTWIVDPDFNLQLYQPQPLTAGTAFWKINFERPCRRTRMGIDTFDLLLDLIGDPTGETWRWKDEDEYDQARRLGVISDAEHRRVERARERALAFVAARQGPLAKDWSSWQVPDEWPLPVLPVGALHADASGPDRTFGDGSVAGTGQVVP